MYFSTFILAFILEEFLFRVKVLNLTNKHTDREKGRMRKESSLSHSARGIAEFAGLKFAGLENDGLENDGRSRRGGIT